MLAVSLRLETFIIIKTDKRLQFELLEDFRIKACLKKEYIFCPLKNVTEILETVKQVKNKIIKIYSPDSKAVVRATSKNLR